MRGARGGDKSSAPLGVKLSSLRAQDHVDLGTSLGSSTWSAPEIAASRFAILSGAGARMERALINFMLDVHTQEHGYTETLPPFIVNANALVGTAQLPKFEADLFKLTDERGLYLSPTAEVPVTNIHREEILDGSELPKSSSLIRHAFV